MPKFKIKYGASQLKINKTASILTLMLALALKAFAQESSILKTHEAEKLWYMQKETWIGGLILFLIIIIGIFYRASRVKKKIIKKTITETIIIKNSPEINEDPKLN